MIFALIGALVLATGAVGWLVFRRPAATQDRAPQQAKPAGGRFGAVEIRICPGACRPARALKGQRFLSKEAPALPLPACTATECTCKFTKWSDRRSESRRLEHGGLSASMFLANNRRTKRERRRAAQARQS
jgi:hypothetical protein